MNFVFEPLAALDFSNATTWYVLKAGTQRASLFEQDLYTNIQTLLSNPEIGAPASRGLRTWRLERHPYTIVYRTETGLVRIVAIAHHRRKPSYWMKHAR